ncbi:MAG: DUF1846 domain-containing protein [Candidatus Omnitrophota bacterium]|nr:DUF1846 domain-containing protein [Candidatus Omnitrophota bacterium]
MPKKTGFDNEKYLKEQSAAILERISKLKGKLYLEFGGKLMYDYHAARVLPGYDPNIKIKLLKQLKDKIDIILCIYAGDIEKGRIRGDFGITYDVDALKLIDDLRENGLGILAVVITRFDNQPQAIRFKNRLENRNIKVYLHSATKGYPTDVDTIVSEEGYGKNPYIETKNPIAIVTAPGPGSGKLATCLSQLYHDYRKGIKSGYAKFETFPIWNIPLKHPVNIAYEAATADIADFNLIDPFHLNTYNLSTVNYNRDVEIFPVVKRILEKITGNELSYQSPTDMGVNRAGFAIVDDHAVAEAAKQEIIRRYFRYKYEYILGIEKKETVEKISLLTEGLNLKPEDRCVVEPARKVALEKRNNSQAVPHVSCGAAIELNNGQIVTGKNSTIMSAASSLILNAIKQSAEIPDKIHLLSPHIINHITILKKDILMLKQEMLDLEETLIALSMSAATNPSAEAAMEKLKELSGCEAHLTHIPTPGDEAGLRMLSVNLTTDGNFPSQDLFML